MVTQNGKFLGKTLSWGLLVPCAALFACATTPDEPAPSGMMGTTGTGGAGSGTGGAGSLGTGGATSGTGGSSTSGTGGNLGTGGGTSTASCFQVASNSFLNFDTYDGENLSFHVAGDPTGGVYMGPWELTDELDATTPDPAPTYALTMTEGFGAAGFSLTVSDQEAKLWGGGVGFWMTNCVDAATYSGIRLQVRGAVPTGVVNLAVSTRDTTPPATDGVGVCTGTACADAVAEIALGADPAVWTQIDLPWSAFLGGVGSEGVAAPLSGFGITGLIFNVSVQYDEVGALPGPYELIIDEIGFF